MNYVVGFMFSTDSSSVLLIKKTKPNWQADKYNGVGGKIEKNETAEAAMVREFGEETGIYAPRWNRFCTLSSPNFPDDLDNWYIDFFYSTGDIFSAKSITEEQVECFKTNMLPPNIIPNCTWLIPMALTDKPYSCQYKITEIYG